MGFPERRQFVNKADSLRTPMVQLPLVRVESDPDFDDADWRRAAVLDPFVRGVKSDGKTPARKETEVRLFHDLDNLHMRVRCVDPDVANIPKSVLPANEKELVVIGDHLEFYLGDPLAEGGYYLFSVSPDDIAADWANGKGEAWDGVWTHRARRTANGWEVLMTIPLKTIRADNAKGNDLKMLVIREADQFSDSSSWGGGRHHQFATFGDVKLLR